MLQELGVISVLVDTFVCIMGKNKFDITKHAEPPKSHLSKTLRPCTRTSKTLILFLDHYIITAAMVIKVTQWIVRNFSQLNRR